MGHDAVSGIGSRATEVTFQIRRQALADAQTAGSALPTNGATLKPVDRLAVNKALQRLSPIRPLAFTAPSGHIAEPNTDPVTANALSTYGGATWVGKLPGNGARDVSILVPPGLDPQKPVEVLILFPGVYKGRNAAQIALQDPKLNFRNALDQLGSQRNTVIVMPTLAYNGQEMIPNGVNDEDVGQLQQTAVEQIQRQWQLTPDRQTVVGYSYGGQPLMNAAESQRLQPGTRLVTLDATYTWQSTGSIAERLGKAAQGNYPLHNFHHTGRATLPLPAGTGTNHVLHGDHGAMPKLLPAVLGQAYAP